MKVAIYAIALNEEANAESWAAACSAADYVIVADTGSTDRTVELLKAAGVTVHNISVKPWRFDVGRNASLALVPADVDVCLPLDLDERPIPGWRAELEKAWKVGETQNGFFTYIFSFKEDGVTPEYIFLQNKIHARYGWAWRYPAHEGVYPVAGNVSAAAPVVVNMVVAQRQLPKPSRNYLDLLRLGVEENPNDTRCAHYYGRELAYNQRWREAVVHLERYIALKPNFPLEQKQNAAMLSTCYEALEREQSK